MGLTTQNDVTNALTTAIQTIAESNVQSKEATLVIEAEIVEIVDEGLGTYIVKYLGNKFSATTAHTEITYEIGDMVYVIIPNGNFDKNKVILSPVTPYTAVYASDNVESSYITIGDNLFKSISDVALCTYKPHDADPSGIDPSPIVPIDTTGFAALFKAALTDSRTFNFTCKIHTEIEKARRSKGNYGLVLDIPVIQIVNDIKTHKFYRVVMDINNITGDPYNLSVPALQNFYFTLPEDMEYDDSVPPQLLSFVVGFIGEDNTKPDDIFITDIQVLPTLEVTEETMSGYYSVVTATGGNSFLSGRTGDIKTLSVTAYYNGKITKVDNFDCYWFKENIMINNASDKFQRFGGLGWEILNKVSQKNVDEDGKINYQYVTNIYTQIIKQEEIHCDTKFKCVLVKGDKIVTSYVTIKNLASDAILELSSITGTTKFATGIGNVNLQLKYYENGITNNTIPTSNVNYAWQRLDKKGNYIDNDFFIIDKFNNKVDNTYYTKIYFPVASIDEANTILCTAYMDTPAGSGNAVNRQIIGTTSITLTTGEMPSSRIVVTNGDKLYKYDADGDSPMVADYDGPLTSAIKDISPISIRIYKEDGSELTEDEYKVVTVYWLVPVNSMITLTAAQKTDTTSNPGYYTITGKYTVNSELTYSINPTYNKKKLDNTIIVQASAPSAILKETISNVANIRFLKDGEGGTNGSKYSAILTYNGYGYGEKDSSGKIYKFQLIYVKDINEWYLYNPARPGVYTTFSTAQLVANLYADGEYYGNSDPSTSPVVTVAWKIFDNTYNYASDNIVTPVGVNSSGVITRNGNNWTNTSNNFCATIEAKVTARRASIDSSQTNSEEYIYAYYPIECTYVENRSCLAGCSPTLDGGFSRVLYASDGTNPQYDNSEDFYVVDSLYEDIEDLYNYSWSTSSNMRVTKSSKNTCKITPASKYDNGVAKNFVRVNLSQNSTTQSKIDIKINELTSIQTDVNNRRSYYQYLQNNLDIFLNFNYNNYVNKLTNIVLFYSIKTELVQTVDKIFSQINFLTSLVNQYKASDVNVNNVYNNIIAVTPILNTLSSLSTSLGTDVSIISQINNIIGPSYLSSLKINKISYAGIPSQSYYFSINSSIDLYNNVIDTLNSIYIKLNDSIIVSSGGYNDIACQIFNDLKDFVDSTKLYNLTQSYSGYDEEVYRYSSLVEVIKSLVNSINNIDSNTYSYNLIIENILTPINENVSWYITFYNDGGYNSLINELNDKYNKLSDEINQLTEIKNSFGIIHVKPIIMIFNRYELSNINGWDGNKLETGDGYLLAPQVGAGKKDNLNRFTGVVIGVKQVQERSISDQKIGLFGYSAGAQSIFLNAEDGSATFGVSGKGQVIIEPSSNKALIKSGNYSTSSKTGMQIDLTTPEIRYGSGNFSVNSSGYITAKGGGSIAGWKITDNQLYSDNATAQYRLTLDSTVDEAANPKRGGRIYSGSHSTLNSNAIGFYVSHDGLSITGQYTEGSGSSAATRKSRIELSTTGNPKIYSGGHNTLTAAVKGFYLGQDGLSVSNVNNDGTIRSRITLSTSGDPEIYSGNHRSFTDTATGFYLGQTGLSICNGKSSRISLSTDGNPEIYSNGHTLLTSTNQGFLLNNDGLSIHNGFRVTINDNNTKLEIGRLTAGNRYWTIQASNDDTHSYIGYDADKGLCFNFDDTTPISGDAKVDSVYIGTNGLRLGQKFAVNSEGQIYANDAKITGNITASSGKIAGFNIDDTTLGTRVGNNNCIGMTAFTRNSHGRIVTEGEIFAWSTSGSTQIKYGQINVYKGSKDYGIRITNGTQPSADPGNQWIEIDFNEITRSDGKKVQWE